MSQNQNNSMLTTAFGLLGGLGKALTAHFILTNITLGSITEVTLYAAISATVGYGVKKGIDSLIIHLKRRKK